MSSIPKIKLTTGRKKEKCNLDFDCSTTANFGVVQPTMAREMIPESKFQVKVSSLVRLAPMPVPTFGRMFLTHRHVFVPYVDICPQFDSFLAGQPYRYPVTSGYSGSSPNHQNSLRTTYDSYVPTSLPPFNSTLISQYLLGQFADWSIHVKRTFLKSNLQENAFNSLLELVPDPDAEFIPFLLPENHESEFSGYLRDFLKQLWSNLFVIRPDSNIYLYGKLTTIGSDDGYLFIMPSAPLNDTNYHHGTGFNSGGSLRLGHWFVNCDNTVSSSDTKFDYGVPHPDGGSSLVEDGYIRPTNYNEFISIDNADYVSRFGTDDTDFLIAFKLKAGAKRVRTIMQGLGYQFTPNIEVPSCNWLKLFAFYKSWFNLYRPKREIVFTDTNCYKMIKACELPDIDSSMYNFDDPNSYWKLTCDFIDDLARDCYNYLPQDYFGMSITQPNRNYQGSADVINTYADGNNPTSQNVVINTTGSPTINGSANYPLNTQIALKVLKYVNKNTIVGRSIHDYIKAHFGISLDSSHDLETVYEIGSVTIPIEVNDVMSTANTESSDGGSFIGEYAGRGIGYNKDDNSFEFENRKNFGVWLTLSCIMPRSGYYQGILRENNNIKKFDFYTPEFDALGYDLLLRSEVSSDYPVNTSRWNTHQLLDLSKAFGFVPRYSFYKVGRNIVNGDLSLRSLKNDMASYTLDRFIPYDSPWIRVDGEANSITSQMTAPPSFYPTQVYDEFRRIDPSDNLGQYNRIFYVNENREDHFIIHNVFDVKAWLPAKSLTESFDTISDDDTNVTEMQHS